MLRVIQVGTSRPVSFPVDPNSTFEPGMICQLKLLNNDVVAGVSDGTAPLGIIDDIKTIAFTASQRDEIVIIRAPSNEFDGYSSFVSTAEFLKELDNANIVPNSFRADYPGLQLNSVNGTLRAPEGTVLNYTTDGSITPNAILARVSYNYYIPNIPGEDSTVGSGKLTYWFTRGVFETDQYEQVLFALNAPLFVSSAGKLTAEQTDSRQPAVAMCTIPPTSHNPRLQFLWF